MTSKIFRLCLLLLTGLCFSQTPDRAFYDKNWKETTKENASFYRIMPSKKIGSLILIEDFYVNNTPQFQGYTLKTNEESYVGDIVWYDKYGLDSSFHQYYNTSDVPVLTYYYPNGKKRKSIEYKNGKKDGLTILYHQGGTVLMKGKYREGKPVEGDFDEVTDWDNYKDNDSEREASSEENGDNTESSAVQAEEVSPIEVATVPEKQVKKKIIKKKIFWINSKQLAQEIWYDSENEHLHPFKQINYNLKGKIMQTLNETNFEKYSDDILNGVLYDYYFQNKFAVAIKSITNYKERQKSGEEIIYYTNGNNFYNEDQTIMKKRTYKNGEPFDGNFDESFSGGLMINENYAEGVKEGEALVKTDTDSVVAKGIYRNGKPWNGKFVVKIDDDHNELIQVTDFKKNGLQKVFNYNINDVIRTYMCLNDVVNGETIFYEDGKVTGKLEYKNGLPFDGKLVESGTETLFKNGVIAEEIFYRSKYERIGEENILKSKYYDNGKLSKIVNRSFAIIDHNQNFYEGVYKNGQPYSGYFATDFNEFNYVDYYENGTKKYQYSNNYLENLENYHHPYYDIKSTYKNGKIVDGVEYIKLDSQFISKYWKNGILQSFDLDIFATHYFNRFHFELKNNSLEITEFNKEKKGKIVREKVDNQYKSQLIIDDKVVMSSSPLELNDAIPLENGSILYYESNNIIDAKILNYEKVDHEEVEYEGPHESAIFYEIFASTINSSKTIEENFNAIVENFSKGKDIDSVFGKGDDPHLISALRFNESKNPEIGILILKNKNNSYDLISFLNGKIVTEKKDIEVSNIREEIKTLNTILEKKMNEDIK